MPEKDPLNTRMCFTGGRRRDGHHTERANERPTNNPPNTHTCGSQEGDEGADISGSVGAGAGKGGTAVEALKLLGKRLEDPEDAAQVFVLFVTLSCVFVCCGSTDAVLVLSGCGFG